MNSNIKRNSILAVILFLLYLGQNILRNMLVNMLAVNEFAATLITAVVFAASALLLTKKDDYFKVRNKDKFCITYIVIVTLILGLINLVPFDISIDKAVLSVIVTMFFVSLMEELIFRGCVYKICEAKWGGRKAVILSSILFGFIHIINVLNDDIAVVALQIASATSIGVVVAILIYKKQGIYLSILAHAVINITANIGATETIYKEIIFSVICVIFAVIVVVKYNLAVKNPGED